MRIMHLVSGMLVNGAVLQCLALCRALAARGHEVMLACRPDSWIGDQLAQSDISVVRSNLRRWPLSDARQLAKLAQSHGIELLHTHQSRAHVCGLLVRWFSGIPCVATAHARHVQPHWCLNDFVIANSQATYDFQRRWNLVSSRKMSVVNYLLELDQFACEPKESGDRLRTEWGFDQRHRVAGLIGDLIPRKGQLNLVRAWPRVLRSVPNARLVFVGLEKDPEYVALIRSTIETLGIGDSIHFAGYHTDMPAVMQAIDLCVSSAVEEALGLTVPEAMAARRAVVATRVGGVPENIWHGETGLLVPRARPAEIAQAIVQLLSNDARREEFGQRGWLRVHDKYDAQHQIVETEDIYKRLVARSRCRVESRTGRLGRGVFAKPRVLLSSEQLTGTA